MNDRSLQIVAIAITALLAFLSGCKSDNADDESGNNGDQNDPSDTHTGCACDDGDTREGATECGLNGNGVLMQLCSDCEWLDDPDDCVDPDECEDGDTRDGDPCAEVCVDGQWEEDGESCGDTETAPEEETDTGTGEAIDTGTGDETDTETDPCADASGQCIGQPDFTACSVVTEPDRSYDICVNERCVSPGCGDVCCNAPSPHFPLPDTNQRLCYSDSGEEIPCPAPGEPFYGQDAQYGWDTTHDSEERFSRDVSTSGQPVVTDTVTGLVWQGCAIGYSGEDCGDVGSPTKFTWFEALATCDSLTWGGYDDWRLPDRYELQSLVDNGKFDVPTIDAAAFPITPSDYFWSSSSFAANTDSAWNVEFSLAHNYLVYMGKYSSYYVRCVRGGPMETRRLMPSVRAGERIVEDTLTGLTWQGCPRGLSGDTCETGSATTSDWQEALLYCEELSWGGSADWRLPNVTELLSITDDRSTWPGVDTSAFPSTPSDNAFLSSSSNAKSPSFVWNVSFQNGLVGSGGGKGVGEFDLLYLRCVRNAS
jgi:hypothetical protein